MNAFIEEAAVGTHLCVLKTRVPGETRWIVLGGSPSASGVGLVTHEEKKARFTGRMPKGHTRIQRLSQDLEGGTVTRIGKKSLSVSREEKTFLVVLRGTSIVVKPGEAPSDDEVSVDDARRAGEALLDGIIAGAAEMFRAELLAALKKARARVARRVEGVARDLVAMSKADDMLLSAQWLLPEVPRVKRGATQMTATDWSTEPPREISVELDPAKSAREQIDALFKRARRLKAGRAFAEPRLAQAQAIADKLAALQADARVAPSLVELESIAAAARAAGPKDFVVAQVNEGGASKPKETREKGYRVYQGAGGARILVGRTAKENDLLTFQVARPHDLWLHVAGRAGAHVVVPRDKGEDTPPELLVDAAHLAAHFSDGRDEAVIDVSYTHRKFIRKPKGGAPGLVTVDREKTIAVRIEKKRLAALLVEGE